MTNEDQFAQHGEASACPDLTTLADFHGGVLDPARHARIAQIVANNAEAREILAGLDATTNQLRSMPAVKMPPALAARLDAVLQHESALRAQAQQSQAQPHPPTVMPSAPGPPTGSANVVSFADAAAKRRGRGRLLLAAAAAAVVVGGGAIVIGTSGGGNNVAADKASTSTSADESATASTAAPSGTVQELGKKTATDVQQSGPIVNGSAPEAIAGSMAQSESRLKCLSLIPKRPLAAPSAVQQGTYQGQSAYAFVFPLKNQQQRLMIVSAADCATVLKDVTEAK
ncbi:MAG: hypothetical protein ABI137_13480 [Antricoccus sp.]